MPRQRLFEQGRAEPHSRWERGKTGKSYKSSKPVMLTVGGINCNRLTPEDIGEVSTGTRTTLLARHS